MQEKKLALAAFLFQLASVELKKFLKSPAVKAGKYEAIISVLVDGRRMLLGFKRKKKSSGKSHETILLRKPVILDELLKSLTHEQRKLYGVTIEPATPEPVGEGASGVGAEDKRDVVPFNATPADPMAGDQEGGRLRDH